MRVFLASFATETNTFSPIPTGALAFGLDAIRHSRVRGGASAPDPMLDVFRSHCEADGHAVIQSISAGAEPAGPTVRIVYEELRDMIVDDLRRAGPVDMILLALHGAMVAQGYDDCEGDLLARLRDLAPKAVIGVELDPHCSLTPAMVAHADLITIMREYPHTDFVTRGRDLYRHAVDAASGRTRPVAATVDCRMTGFFPTEGPAMRDLVEAFVQSSAVRGVITAELVHGFPWGDVPDMGARVLVYADGDTILAAAEAERLAGLVYDQRRALASTMPGLTESLDRALALEGLTVLGDFADNPGGGAPGDSTHVLQELLARGVRDAAIGAFYDPEAARLCGEAGAGTHIQLRLGGKLCAASGQPVDLDALVLAASEDHGCTAFGMRASFGRSAAIRCQGLEILIVSTRSQLYGADGLTDLGIELEGKRLVVVKSSNHYAASFGPLADHLWHMATPGAMSLDFASIPYRRLDRPLFPMVDDPWADSDFPMARIAFGEPDRV